MELYDLAADPGERNEIAASHPDVVRQIEKIMSSARIEDPEWPILSPGEARKRAV
jgi:hypothetical protein